MERVDLRVLQRERVAPSRYDDVVAELSRMEENARKTVATRSNVAVAYPKE